MTRSVKKSSEPETYIRVKLPLSYAYPSCPSGDTDYEVAYDKAIKTALPDGWMVVPQLRLGYRPAMDSDGMSLIRVKKV